MENYNDSANISIIGNNVVLNVSKNVVTYDMYIMLSIGQTKFKHTTSNFLIQVEQ